jgi:peptide-methionine (S)-S-oxide reductase
VLDTVVGYCGGTTDNPTYEAIGDHTEAMRIVYDPKRVDLAQIYRIFWESHTPSPSYFGKQYRSAIFCHGESQRLVAQAVYQELAGDSPFASELDATAIEDAGPFYRAEEYHQRWIQKQSAGVNWSPAI